MRLAAWTNRCREQETRNGSRVELGWWLSVTTLITLSASFQENSISYSKADLFLVVSDERVDSFTVQAMIDFRRESHIENHRLTESWMSS